MPQAKESVKDAPAAAAGVAVHDKKPSRGRSRGDERSPGIVYQVAFDREADGRWRALVPDLPGVMTYGDTREAALAAVQALALRVVADRIEHGEAPHGAVVALLAKNQHPAIVRTLSRYGLV